MDGFVRVHKMSWNDILLTLGFTGVFIALSKFAGWLMPGNTWEIEKIRDDDLLDPMNPMSPNNPINSDD